MYEIGLPPMREGSSEAPMTATELGLSNLAIRERSFGRARGVDVDEAAAVLLAVLIICLSAVVVCCDFYDCFPILQLH
jgi:hypothetical protein